MPYCPRTWEPCSRSGTGRPLRPLSREVATEGRVFDEAIQLVPEFGAARVYARDITLRKRVEEALKESEERVRLKLESILAPEGDIGDLELADIIDIEAMQAPYGRFLCPRPVPHVRHRSQGHDARGQRMAGYLHEIPPGPPGDVPPLCGGAIPTCSPAGSPRGSLSSTGARTICGISPPPHYGGRPSCGKRLLRAILL